MDPNHNDKYETLPPKQTLPDHIGSGSSTQQTRTPIQSLHNAHVIGDDRAHQQNQREDVFYEREQTLRKFLATLPSTPYVAAYGSATFPQRHNHDVQMLDLIIGVDATHDWHLENVASNPSHYSFLRHFGIRTIDMIQSLPAKVYYNTGVNADTNLLVKYGVISLADLRDDLLHWRNLYLSGRMHKPIRTLHTVNDIELARSSNLRNALKLSCLLHGRESCDEKELYSLIAGLSYTGDVRMGVAEDPNKIGSIVHGSWKGFQQMYRPIMSVMDYIQVNSSRTEASASGLISASKYDDTLSFPDSMNFIIDQSPAAREVICASLPDYLITRLAVNMKIVQPNVLVLGMPMPQTEVAHRFAKLPIPSQNGLLNQSLHEIVKKGSQCQSLKGLLTTGFRKSMRYAARKLNKVWRIR